MTQAERMHSSVTLAWSLTITSMTGFAVLAVMVSQNMTAELDQQILTSFRDTSGEITGPMWVRESLLEITSLGGYPVIVLAVIAGISGLICVGKKTAAWFLTLSVGGGSALSSLLKLVFDRPRPDLVVHLDQIYTSSFPSAHAMVSMVTWLTMALVMMRFMRNDRLRILILGYATLLSLIIGFSRVFLGVHWPTDVLAGWLLGIAWSCASWLCAHYLASNNRIIGQFGRST